MGQCANCGLLFKCYVTQWGGVCVCTDKHSEGEQSNIKSNQVYLVTHII